MLDADSGRLLATITATDYGVEVAGNAIAAVTMQELEAPRSVEIFLDQRMQPPATPAALLAETEHEAAQPA